MIADRAFREDGQILDGFLDAVVVDVVACCLRPEDEVIADVLLDEAVSVMAADHRIGQVHVLDLGLQLAAIMLGDLATEDDGDLVRLADGSIGVEQTFAELVQRGAATEDQVVAELDLREEQPVLAARMFSLSCGEEGCEMRQPFLTAGHQIPRGERVGEFLQAIGCCAFQEGIGDLLEIDAFLTHAVRQPMVLIEADTGGERKVGADAHEHSSPIPVVDVKVVLNDPAMGDLKMPSVRDFVADGDHDARRLASFEDDHDCVGLGPFEIRVDEFVATALRRLDDRNVALRGPLLHPALKLVGDVAQGIPRHRV